MILCAKKEQHHDYIEFHDKRAQGVRILTVFLYLNDVEKGMEVHRIRTLKSDVN